MGSTRRQTQQKRAREQAVRERRDQKQAKKRAALARKAQAGEKGCLPHSTNISTDVPAMKLAVGDDVVYGPHGVGRITARQKRPGESESEGLVVLALHKGLTVTLRATKALEQLRPLADEAELLRIEDALRADCDVPSGPWLSRKKGLQAKLTASDSVQLAEIVAEGSKRGRLRLAAGNKEPFSPGERSFFLDARALLAGEIAAARGLEQTAADDWIDEHLARPGR